MRKKGGGEKGGRERKQEGACAGRTDRDRPGKGPQGPGGCLGPQEGVSSVESSDDFAQPFPCPANARFDGGLR